tara:strand:- start:608 stop:751 length:144 start_codon:yes stop_codon:yes gene_type:complete
MEIIIDEYTNQEIDFLSEMILEKLNDKGYNPEAINFNLSVQFEENNQ